MRLENTEPIDFMFAGLAVVLVLLFGSIFYALYQRENAPPELYWECMDAYQAMPAEVPVAPMDAHRDCIDRWQRDYWGRER